MDMVIRPGSAGGYEVLAEGDVPLARYDDFDTVYLLLYALANHPGAAELLAQSPEVMASFDSHCGVKH